jgi:hypothetical protein
MIIVGVIAGWALLSFLAVVAVAGMCRVGHGEDVRLGYVDLADAPHRPSVPAPRSAADAEPSQVDLAR